MSAKVHIKAKLHKKTRAQDPDLTKASHGVNQPEVAPLTTGPNRYTIRVPSLATKLSLGQGDATDAVRFNKRVGVGTESGIVAQTDSHVHVHTFGTESPEAKTIVRLGIPTTSIPCEGPTYSAGAETGIGALLPSAFTVWEGFSMLTQGASYQESRNNHLVVSAEGEVRVVAKTLVNLATPGDVLIVASTDGTTEEMVQNTAAPTDPIDRGVTEEDFRQNELMGIASTAQNILMSTIEFVDLVRAMVGVQMHPAPGLNTWLGPDYTDNLAAIAGAVGILAEAASLVTELAGESPGGNVNVFANANATIGASKKTSLFGLGTVQITGGVAATMNGGVTASIHAGAAASTGALWVSSSALVSNSVEALFKGVDIKGCSGVTVSSLEGPVCVTSGPSVQLNAVEGCAWVSGGLEAFIGSGVGPGTGLYSVGAEFMFIGSMGAASNMIMPVPVPAAGITFTPELMIHQMGESLMAQSDIGFDLVSPEIVTVTSPVITLTGGFVYLG